MTLPSSDLEAELRRHVSGAVRFDTATRAAYAVDASNYRHVPVGVVVPRDADDVMAAVSACSAADVPVLGRGAGTSLAGQACNTGIVLDFSRHMDGILSIDQDAAQATVQPGVILDDLQRALAPRGLRFGPDPATHSRCTFGGMIGNNSCGVHSLTSGRTSDNVISLDVLTYDGVRLEARQVGRAGAGSAGSGGATAAARIVAALEALGAEHEGEIRARFPAIPRRVSGYNLDELLPGRVHLGRALVGSESTCAITLAATVKLVPSPAHRVLVVLGYSDIVAAAMDVPAILEHSPYGLEGIDRMLRITGRGAGSLPAGDGFLLVEFAAQEAADAAGRASDLASRHRGEAVVLHTPADQAVIWKIREAAVGTTSRLPGRADAWAGFEDSAVAPERLGPYLRGLSGLLDRYGYSSSLYGHFGEGCVHARIDFDLESVPGVGRFDEFMRAAGELCVAHGGSLSGEHGDGQARSELLPLMFGDRIVEAFRAFKAIFDPRGRMNPGRIVDPLPMASDLRLGPGRRLLQPTTKLGFTADEGRFSRAVTRCVGVGSCVRTSGGTMCPSFMATRDEVHSTRGRSHLLVEMLQGDLVSGGWRSTEVRDALDLCLGCKACKSECPAGVDMAAYKSEFLSQHYARRVRPATHYSLGLFGAAARAARRAPRLANAVTNGPLGGLVKAAAGLTPHREIPAFAPVSFRAGHRPSPEDPAAPRGPVVLFTDTFDNHLEPNVAHAAVRVLRRAGFGVQLTTRDVCCGLPLLTTGMLGLARRTMTRTVDELAPFARAGLPVVVLEPSCAAALADDLPQVLTGVPDAELVAGSIVSLAGLLQRHDAAAGRLDVPALFQAHCHQRAVFGVGPELDSLRAVSTAATDLDAGCCGLAGSFGFEREHYEVSMACGERVLLPAVREASPETLIVSDGFSCRTQIEHGTGRRALHTAEVLDMAGGR